VAAGGAATALLYAAMHVPHLQQPRPRLVFKKEYTLYYALELFAGARKQIFLTFGPWVLIRMYHLSASRMGALLTTAALIGILVRPAAGMAMDRFGERAVMIADGLALSVVCIGYGYAGGLTSSADHARILASACYVLDNLLFSLGDARTLYLSRLSRSPQEMTSTLAMGVSINHVASMTIPAVAGLVWVRFGYGRVFLAAAALAILIAALATRVPSKRRRLRGTGLAQI
jgi:MFS family permease